MNFLRKTLSQYQLLVFKNMLTVVEKESLFFHLQSNDYFGTLDTRLDLLKQDVCKKGFTNKHNKILSRAIRELIFLQNNNFIIEKHE